jgi:hypothetical protein
MPLNDRVVYTPSGEESSAKTLFFSFSALAVAFFSLF